MNQPFTTARSQVTIAAGCWLVLALFLAESQCLALLPASAVFLLTGILALLPLLAYRRQPAFRTWIHQLNLWWILLPCALRAASLIGLSIASFRIGPGALRLGIVLVLLLEIFWACAAVCLLLQPRSTILLRRITLWNTASLAGLLAWTIPMAARIATAPPLFGSVCQLPLGLIPTFLLPLILASHLLLLFRIRNEDKSTVAKEQTGDVPRP